MEPVRCPEAVWGRKKGRLVDTSPLPCCHLFLERFRYFFHCYPNSALQYRHRRAESVIMKNEVNGKVWIFIILHLRDSIYSLEEAKHPSEYFERKLIISLVIESLHYLPQAKIFRLCHRPLSSLWCFWFLLSAISTSVKSDSITLVLTTMDTPHSVYLKRRLWQGHQWRYETI